MLSYNVPTAVQQALKARTDWLQGGQTLMLAARITPTTVDPLTGQASQRCPDCWDESLRQATVPNDPTCFGVGWIIPASGSQGQQGGYLAAVALGDAFINDQEDRTTWTPQGFAQYTVDRLYMSIGNATVKKGDLIIRAGGNLPHSRRYVVEDEDAPKTLGGAIEYETALLEYHRPDAPVYAVPPADLTGLSAGTWS